MLSEIFYWVLNISVIGGVTGLIVMLLRSVKRLPRFAVYLFWTLPLIRLWIPFGLANQYSLLNLISKFTTKTVLIWERVPDITMTNTLQAASEYFPIVYKTNLLESVFAIASLVWAIVASTLIFTAFLLYSFTKSELKSARHIRDNLYKSDQITSPAVYGIIKPKIILPAALAEGDMDYILMHERVHIHRRDNLWRVAAILTACIHWFNPLVWIFLKTFFADMELACDSKVMKQLGEFKAKDYAAAVLSAAKGKAFFVSAFGGAKTRVRIENILSYKKLTFLSALCFLALCFAVAVILITNAVS